MRAADAAASRVARSDISAWNRSKDSVADARASKRRWFVRSITDAMKSGSRPRMVAMLTLTGTGDPSFRTPLASRTPSVHPPDARSGTRTPKSRSKGSSGAKPNTAAMAWFARTMWPDWLHTAMPLGDEANATLSACSASPVSLSIVAVAGKLARRTMLIGLSRRWLSSAPAKNVIGNSPGFEDRLRSVDSLDVAIY